MDTLFVMLKNVIIFVLLAIPGYLMVKGKLLKNGVDSRYKCIHSVKGHDSFLLEPELYEADIKAYLQ